eukprot:TRINITY_DN78228_c0_g1_i1.p1 TRINITY_DN78228_c0_g1~~TRINITY_DN78228_c0_g1_i1.p1  ORF type:complete len:172 (+),score=14.22 TRINITY_DN78228_c0_g1_i1:65-517(+)
MTDKLPENATVVKQFINAWVGFVHSKQFTKLSTLFADKVTFYSPVVHTVTHDHAYIMQIMLHIVEIVEDFHYTGLTMCNSDNQLAMMFRGTVKKSDGSGGTLIVEGMDIVKLNEQGKMVELRVMMRPMSAVVESSKQMRARFKKAKVSHL